MSRAALARVGGLVAVALGGLVGCQTVVAFDDVVERGAQCGDGIDNDGDGPFDCEDPACALAPACSGCGNGVPDDGEQCDDGNAIPDDGCSPDCTFDPCGNSAGDPGERCDDGNRDDTDSCPSTCQPAVCGDGFVHAGNEACDDGNADDTDDCPSTCNRARCGDGFVQAGAEACDDGNLATNDGCGPCVIERCGDGIAQTSRPLTQIAFRWLASSCTGPADIQFRITNSLGQTFEHVAQADAGSCTCAPPEGYRTVVAPATAVDVILNGPTQLTVDFSGPGHYLAWAVVSVYDQSETERPYLVYEGAPGVGLARASSLCTGGFDEDVPVTTATPVIPSFETCDDGNQTDRDGCDRNCTRGVQ